MTLRSYSGLILALTVALSGCGSALSEAVSDYEAGRTTHALRRLRSMPQAEWGSPGGARYSLYRGLAHLTLGDVVSAERWLLSLKHRVEREPQLLSSLDQSRLVSALGAMGHLPGD